MARLGSIAAACLAAVALASVAPAQEHERPKRVVRITAPDGTGVPGVIIREARSSFLALTGVDGVATVVVRANSDLELRCAGDLQTIAAGDGRQEFVAEGLPELVVTAVRASDGERLHPASATLEIGFELRVGVPVDATSGVMRRSAIAMEWVPRRFGESHTIEVETRNDDAGLMGSTRIELPLRVSGLVRRLDVVAPIRRRCRIRLRAVDEKGAALKGAYAWVSWAGSGELAGSPAPYVEKGESGSDGVVEVDIPYFANDAVSVRILRGPSDGEHVEGRSAPIKLRPGLTKVADVTLSRDESSPFGPGGGGTWGIGGGSPERPEPEDPIAFVVKALDSQGRPLPRVTLLVDDGRKHYARAGLDGIAAFTGLHPGSITVALADSALPPHSVSPEVRSGGETVVTLASPSGRDLEVKVVHADGSPAAFAEVVCATGKHRYWPVADDAWRSRLTDHNGAIRIPGAPRGAVTLEVSYGSRRVTVSIAPDHGGKVRVALPAALR